MSLCRTRHWGYFTTDYDQSPSSAELGVKPTFLAPFGCQLWVGPGDLGEDSEDELHLGKGESSADGIIPYYRPFRSIFGLVPPHFLVGHLKALDGLLAAPGCNWHVWKEMCSVFLRRGHFFFIFVFRLYEYATRATHCLKEFPELETVILLLTCHINESLG